MTALTPGAQRWFRIHSWVSLGCLCAALSLPFLMPYHRLPIPTFYQEWWTASVGLAAMSLLLWARARVAPPFAAWLPGILIACLVVQLLVHRSPLIDPQVTVMLYLVWAIGIMVLTRALSGEVGSSTVAQWLAAAILIGALASAAIGILQLTGAFAGTGFILAMPQGRIYGNFAQGNHFSDHLWLGIAAAIYLRCSRRLPTWLATSSIAILGATSILSASRSIWVFALGLVLVATALRRRMPADQGRRFVFWSCVAMSTLVAAQIWFSIWPIDFGAITTSGERIFRDVESNRIRFGLWLVAAKLWMGAPLLGSGWGEFASHGYAIIESLNAGLPQWVFLRPGENAHNVLLALLSELGLPAGIAALLVPLLWLRRTVAAPLRTEHILAFGLLSTLAVHSLLEYPLWYLGFLGIAAIAASLTELVPSTVRPERKSVTLLAVLALVSASGVLGILRNDYGRLEAALYWPMPLNDETPQARTWADIRNELDDLRRHSMFSRYVDLAMTAHATIDRENLEEKIAIAEHAMRFSPTEHVVLRHAALLALAGRTQEAELAWRRALAVYPGIIEQAVRLADEWAKRHPELAILLDLATKAQGAGPT